MRIIFTFLLALFCFNLSASTFRPEEFHFGVSAIRPAFPFTKLYGIVGDGPIHPMIEVGTTYHLNRAIKNQFTQDVNIGFAYHRFLQSMVPLYTECKYFRLIKKVKVGAGLGAGYLHSFELTDQFKLVNGVYEKVGQWGRPQFMFKIGVYFQFQNLTLGYNNIIQAPFVKSYVPLMPYNSLCVSYSICSYNCPITVKNATHAHK